MFALKFENWKGSQTDLLLQGTRKTVGVGVSVHPTLQGKTQATCCADYVFAAC